MSGDDQDRQRSAIGGHSGRLFNEHGLGDCPRCGSAIGEAQARCEPIERPSSGTYREFEPGPLEVKLKPCGCWFEGPEAVEVAVRIKARRDQDRQR